ncbi:MAG: hypothetical protein K2K41_01200, partial [Ruminiclostridium sp.]|nr:hypothetical protein [Ruminiclostridium sp.]
FFLLLNQFNRKVRTRTTVLITPSISNKMLIKSDKVILILDKNKTKTAGRAFLIKEVPTQEYSNISSRADADQGRPGRWICLIFIEI